MPTLNGTILDGSGTGIATTLTFDTVGDPVGVSGGIMRTRSRVTATSASNGTFSVVLVGGAWRMRWSSGGLISETIFTMPPAGGPYTLTDMIFNAATDSTARTLVGIAGRAALRALTTHTDRQVEYLLYLVSADDGQGGEFEFRALSTAEDDGTSVFKPNDIADGAPGRWHALNNAS